MDYTSNVDETLLDRLCGLLHVEPDRIKLNESFVRNGGDSLLAIRFSNVIQKSEQLQVGAGVILREKQLGTLLDKTQLRTLATEPSTQPACSSTIDPSITVTASQDNLEDKTLDPIQRFPKVIPSTGLPITFIQAGTAHYAHLIPGAAVQHVTQYCYTDALPKLKAAFAKAMSRYQIFRLNLQVETDPLLIKASLKDDFRLNWEESQVDSLEGPDLEDSFRNWSIEASTEPVFRILTPSNSTSDRSLSVVHWFYHLSLMDGRSIDILLKHVDTLMQDLPILLKVNDNTFDVVKGLADYHDQHAAAARTFWNIREVPSASRNHPLLHALGTRTPSVVRMRSVDVFYPEDVKAFQARTGFTFEVLARAALALVLAKLQDAITVSLMSVSSRRSLPITGIEEAVGSFASSMILSVEINNTDTAHELLEQVFHKLLELDDMSYSDPSDGFSIGGLVVVSSDLQPHAPWYSDNHRTEIMSPKETLPTLYVGSNGRVRFCYNSEWRTPAEMQVMADLFESALFGLGSGTLGVAECLSKMLTAAARERIMTFGNCLSNKTTQQGIDDDIVSLFEKQVELRGGAPALTFCGESISYNDLARRIVIIGSRVKELLQPGSVVMLHADGSINWVVAMFAILWADCIFSPQSTNLPHALRSQHYAIADAQAFLVPQDSPSIPTPDGCHQRLCVETLLSEASQTPSSSTLTPRSPNPHCSAYICFSSGTTGTPKAILCTHSGVTSLLCSPTARLHVTPSHTVSQTLAPQFDGALLEVFATLCHGGKLHLKDPLNPFAHLRGVGTMMLTPSLALELDPEDFINNVRYIYFAGEVLPQATADRWAKGKAEVCNVYGPTETHILATAQRVQTGKPVTIGRPLLSTRVYILDKKGELLPPLVAGEIYIGGVSVSRGYLGLKEENALRFVPDTICSGGKEGDGKMYRTGDWGFWTLEGEVAFLGRTDRQVKVGGFRVDLNDVQARIQGVVGGKVKVAVVVVDDVLGCAIEDTGTGTTEEWLRQKIEGVLPPQMVPKILRIVERMPVSEVGKVDLRGVKAMLES
ncbi:NRPS-like enzyme like protein [Zymoseptoria brevis]|uniref:NRPS-like enzyme like protein n=1 Tax=Zymoseptoria brevis TaxID=1047168 RepID=A0A0F4GMH3_9PEZI|nr:NRPS-like enzyme like protein [Zymoseptoria brevis]